MIPMHCRLGDEEEAYEKVAQELGVQTLKLGYMPEEMYFESVVIEDGYGKLQYKYKNSQVSFIQAKARFKYIYGAFF